MYITADAKYNPKDFAMHYEKDAPYYFYWDKYQYNADSFLVFAHLRINEQSYDETKFFSPRRYALTFYTFDSYESQQPVVVHSIEFPVIRSNGDEKSVWFEFKIPKYLDKGRVQYIMVLDQETSDVQFYDRLNVEFIHSFPYQALRIRQRGIGLPEPFAKVGKELQVNTYTQKDIFAYYYSFDFEAALPPNGGVPSSGNMQIDSTFSMSYGQIEGFNEKGFYFFQEDTSSKQGHAFRIVKENFPKVDDMEDLISALRYITTDNELLSIKHSKDSKQSVDDLWIRFGLSKENARRMIRLYYKRMERANLFFSSYKEGWKSDRGMIFMIFGPPENVYKDLEGETWYYGKGGRGEVKFRFQRNPILFDAHHMVLLRDASLGQAWYDQVALWRKGLIK